MIQRSNQVPTTGHAGLSAEDSRQILSKLRDLNLSAERLRLADGRRIDIRGCLNPDQPTSERIWYRLGLDADTERLLGIDLAEGRLRLSLGISAELPSERSRYLNLVPDALGRACSPALEACLDPDTSDSDEVQGFLRGLVLACLPAARASA
ncbi:MAG: hypothetical protein P1V81_10110 [Planctomycetota bacterium]|nr:hypothetical protein [Planctomycetota bacterium]